MKSDDFRFLASQSEFDQQLATMGTLAKLCSGFFKQLISEDFTRQEALYMTGEWVKSLLGQSKK